MRKSGALEQALVEIDGRGYKSYKSISGAWGFADFDLHIDHVQGDPFAAPSRLRVLVSNDVAKLDPFAFEQRDRALGTAAFLARSFAERARGASRKRGSGRSGEIAMEHPGQVVMPQTAVQVGDDGSIEARFVVGLPANGRRVDGRAATDLLVHEVPRIVRSTLFAEARDDDGVAQHAACNEDAATLRAFLSERGLIAFVADGAVLPRRTGIDDTPLGGPDVVAFESPPSLRTEVDLPHAGCIAGLGIPEGVTLIVGGGFHGKSTLLRAIQAGVYNHRPGDGRELVVSRQDTTKVRAEDGRAVAGVDIRAFIDDLPGGRSTARFTTSNASGSTSQAATIIEALEAGAGTILVDEDTSATNFMIRDRRMQELVPDDGEPITPFVDRIRDLYEQCGVSSVIVIGGSGDYLDVADHVIRMADYTPIDITADAQRVAADHPTGRALTPTTRLELPPPRRVRLGSLDPAKGRRARNVKAPDGRTLLFGRTSIDLAAVEQIVSRSQSRAVGNALAWLAETTRESTASVADLLDAVDAALADEGLDAFATGRFGNLAWFRRQELAATLNRLRTLRVE